MQAAQVLIAAIVSQLKDADAKALLTAVGTYRRGKFCPMKPIADEASAQIPTLRHLVVFNQVGDFPHFDQHVV